PQDSLLVSHYYENTRSKTLRENVPTSTKFGSCSKHQLQLTQALHPGQFNLLLFGAGHLGQALVPLLSSLPCKLQWFDSREQVAASASAPHAPCEWLESPSIALTDAPTASLVLVMTHNHALDFEITAAALRNKHIAWVGMIGSEHKRKQFERSLRRSAKVLDTKRLACPIGQRHTDLRDPAELALVLATELLYARNQVQHDHLERYHA
ncbi:MAG: XdhC family protein, partial [Granulosicoccaceae bacterium]